MSRNRLSARYSSRVGSLMTVNLFKFPNYLYDNASNSQSLMMKKFETMINGSSPKYYLRQSDFSEGTLRITKPGVYILKENIIFNPPTQFPTHEQTKYPMGKDGPYHLGFFAAIAIETSNVIIDLNGKSITQSAEHNLIQRFFSVIELANSPFIPGQGPHSFIDTFGWKPASNTLIMNGGLLNSSHHGVHGNENNNVMIYNTNINNYEVAGVALNGATGSIISNNIIKGNNSTVKVLAAFSQSIFVLWALEQKRKTDSDVYINLNKDVNLAKKQILNNQQQSTYFENTTGKYDGNMYGIVLNVRGVVINKFIEERTEEMSGNQDILVINNYIRDVDSHPVEIVALAIDGDTQSEGAYGAKRMVGPFGDVLEIENIMDGERKYDGTTLSEAQLYLAANYSELGTVNITQQVINWSKSEPKQELPQSLQFVPEGDSMGHFMKGNIGIFVSAGININLLNNRINNVSTHGTDVGTCSLFTEDQKYSHGANSYGILQTASKNISGISTNSISNIITEQSKAQATPVKTINQ